jgi:diguanylate cyclase (GGDEF)-like protein
MINSITVWFITPIVLCILVFIHALIVSSKNNEIKKLKKELNNAFFDPLTRAHSRNFFEEEIENFLKRAIRSNQNIAFLVIDLDGLKSVNDTLGHAAGDQMIMAAAEEIRQVIRSTDMFVRIGGDEFLIIAEYKNLDSLEIYISRIEKRISKFSYTFNNSKYFANASVGYSTATLNNNCCKNIEYKTFAESFIAKADKEMYKHKKSKQPPKP